jgi:hypothetical protein
MTLECDNFDYSMYKNKKNLMKVEKKKLALNNFNEKMIEGRNHTVSIVAAVSKNMK